MSYYNEQQQPPQPAFYGQAQYAEQPQSPYNAQSPHTVAQPPYGNQSHFDAYGQQQQQPQYVAPQQFAQQPQSPIGQPQSPISQHQYAQQSNLQSHNAIVGTDYLVSQPTTLQLTENPLSFSGDDFSISDNTGKLWFKVDAKAWSLNQKRTILDQRSMPVLELKKSIFSFGTKWQALNPTNNQILFTVKPKIFTLTPHISIYLNDRDGEPDFKISGAFDKKDFKIYDKRGGGGKILIASCSKQSPFQSIQAFMRSMIGADSYYLQIQPGTDAAFCVSLCLLLDEIYHDKRNPSLFSIIKLAI